MSKKHSIFIKTTFQLIRCHLQLLTSTKDMMIIWTLKCSLHESKWLVSKCMFSFIYSQETVKNQLPLSHLYFKTRFILCKGRELDGLENMSSDYDFVFLLFSHKLTFIFILYFWSVLF